VFWSIATIVPAVKAPFRAPGYIRRKTG